MPHKFIGPKGVSRHQLSPRDDGASSSSSRPDPQAEIERLSAELAQATRDRAMDAIQVGELQGQLRRLTRAHLSCERMMGHLIEERNEAWRREDMARARTDKLEFYVEDIEEYNNNLHEELHVM
jgi:chromosome segregation ATPase